MYVCVHDIVICTGLDIHLDMPTETLHTILLGVAKYLWTESVCEMDKTHAFALFSTRLRSVSVSGLDTGPVPGYIISNRGSLNGKHFKFLLQTACFCLYNLVPTDVIHAWTVLGRLTVLAWYPSIDSIDKYMVCNFICIYTKYIPNFARMSFAC
jgi:hypothetical protein